MSKEALFYTKTGQGSTVQCFLCPHRCVIKEGKRGICGVRQNESGRLLSLVYGKVVACNVDPIEKKPLFHFQPGSTSLSIATVGCNFQCLHCQNHDISQLPSSQGRIAGRDATVRDIVATACRERCTSISYTYTEPTIYFEFAYDTAVAAVEQGLKNVFVTNGFIEPEALRMVSPYLHAANVDLKAFSDRFYRTICKARLQPVLRALEVMKELGIWIEITTLIIPGLNDHEKELRDLARFIVGLGKEVPWHISAFHPTYRMTQRPRTPVAVLRRIRSLGMEEGLAFVYTGNVPGDEGENTFCPGCGTKVIERVGFRVVATALEGNRCARCKVAIPLIS